jgi:hypothetical protein
VGDAVDADDPIGNLAYVISPSGHREQLPVAGYTVGEIRRRLADRLNIDATATPMVGSQMVGDDVVLQAGQYLLFRRAAGEKGRQANRWRRTP